MTESKLWDFWEKFAARWHLSLPDEVTDYLHGARTDVDAQLDNIAKKYQYSPDYPGELVRELSGENAALAGRMLRVLSRLRRQGIIQPYGWEEDTRVCARVGYSLEELLRAGYFRRGKYSAGDTYALAALLVRELPEPSACYADSLLLSNSLGLDALIKGRKSDYRLYLLLDIACALLLTDPDRYKRFLSALEQCAKKLGEDHLVVMLYHAYPLSGVLRTQLCARACESIAAAQALARFCVPAGSFPDFLRELELPHYVYYALVAVNALEAARKPQLFERLYETDHDTFMETYRRVFALQSHEQSFHAIGLLAILLRHKEGARELSDARAKLAAYPGLINNYFGEKQDFVRDFLLCDDPVDTLAERLHFSSRYLQYGQAGPLLELYAPLYTECDVAKKLYDLLIAACIHAGDLGNLASVLSFFMSGRASWLGLDGAQSAQILLDGGLARRWFFAAYCCNAADSYSVRTGLDAGTAAALATGHEDEALSYLSDEQGRAPGWTVAWLTLLYDHCALSDLEPLAALLASKSKLVRTRCEELLSKHGDAAHSLLEPRLPKLKGEAEQAALRIIKRLDNERRFGPDFHFESNEDVAEFCQLNYNKPAEKLIRWIPAELFGDIRYADLSGTAPAEVARYVLVEYLSLTDPYRILACDRVVARLHPQDWQAALQNILTFWIETGAQAKHKSILVPYCIYAGDPQIIAMRRQIEQWAEASRGALGAYAVGALALGGGSVALMMVDAIAQKFPNNQVKNAARAAFAYAAKVLGVAEDELSDRIVPSLGFSPAWEKVLDYGARTFTVSLLPDFTLEVYDAEKGKRVASLPKPNAKDDPVRAEAAKKEFSELKKQMKAVVQTQSARLEKVLMNGRTWSAPRWRALFVDNPILHRFATGLIWGVYEEGALSASFRYMEDGTFNTVDEEEFDLPQSAEISLAHPADLGEEQTAAWRRQLEDYEVAQPIEQLDRRPVYLREGDLEGRLVVRYRGKQVPAGRLAGLAKKYSMVRGDVLDGGSYCCFHLVDAYLSIGVQLNFEYMYMGQEFSELVPLGAVVFYRLAEGERPADEVPDTSIMEPGALPARFVSSVLGVFDLLVG